MTNIGIRLSVDGFAHLPRHDPEQSTIEVANSIGYPLKPRDGPLVQRLTPKAEAPPNTYSGNFGLNAFPFHTDLAHWRSPPRYLLLRCLNGYKDVPTLLIDGIALASAIGLNLLGRAIVKGRRPQNGAVPLLRLYDQVDGCARLRWDEIFLKPAGRAGQDACDRMRQAIADGPHLPIALHEPGDTLIIDNWRMLHARSPVAAGREDRVLERVYLEELT
ncbi:TauD/TfdA family dioxygenase [Ensifer sp. IC3342]|nr:TauD/TfdA family dioxygenase [Ensifer sp. BRP08]MCA1445040.1 TauD/TfdA family dioxygenase [Ensifer sp. IC3342]